VIPAFLNKEVLLAVGLRERHTAIKVIEIAGLAARIRPAGIIDPPTAIAYIYIMKSSAASLPLHESEQFNAVVWVAVGEFAATA
jgi:hypothetical protein